MFRIAGLVISIGIADSINPSTIAPALFLASGDRPRSRVAAFTAAVFVVYLAGGALIALGPGELLRSSLPHLHRTVRGIAEIVAGAILLAAAVLVWRRRRRLAERGLPQREPERRSSALLGATITAVELPTAFPYFAAIAAILGSGLNPLRQFGLLVIFNVCFVLPLLAIVGTLTFASEQSERALSRARRFLERRWPQVLTFVLAVIGVVAIFLGISNLTVHGYTHLVGSFVRVLAGTG